MTFTPVLITDSEMSGNLKNVYNGFRTKLFPISTPTFAQIQKEGPGGPKRIKWGGNGAYGDAVLTGPGGWAASSGGNLPQGNTASEKQFTYGVKRLYMTKAIDGLIPPGTQSKQAAFVDIQTKIMDELDSGSQLMMEEVLNGDGLGIVAVIGTATDTTHSIVSKPYGFTGAGQGGLWIQPGVTYAVVDATGVTVRGRSKVTSVTNSGDNCTIVWTTAIAATQATDLIVRCTDTDTSYNDYPNGLANILNRGGSYNSFAGLSPATAGQERWNTTRLVAGTDVGDASQINELDLWVLAARVGAASGIDPNIAKDEFFFHGTKGLELQLLQNALAQRERTVAGGTTMKVNGDYEVSSFSGVPYITSAYAPAGEVKMAHKPSLLWVDAAEWAPVQFEDSGSWRWIDMKDAFSITYKQYLNIGTNRRNAHGVLSGYTDTLRFTSVM